MGLRVRLTLIAVLVAALAAFLAPAAQASFGIERFQALTCKTNAPIDEAKECNEKTTGEFYTQAGGHPEFSVTDFTLKGLGGEGNGIKSLRIDLPPGLSTNPEALPKCPAYVFEANLGTAEANHCAASTQAGIQEVVVNTGKSFATLVGTVYNLDPRTGSPLEFGIDVDAGVHSHSLLVGGVSWHTESEAEEEGVVSGDYHQYFKLDVPRSVSEGEVPLVRSRLIFNGRAGKGLIRNPTTCDGPLTTHVRIAPYEGATVHTQYTTSVETEGCGVVPFEPLFSLTPSTTQRDEPDGITTELKVHQAESASAIEASDLESSTVVLPEGLTINPAGANGLEACTPSEVGIGSAAPVSCPSRSAIGSAELEVPELPSGSLVGSVYLGNPAAPEPITGPPYTIYLAVESERYGQAVRLAGTVTPNLLTGQLTATFAKNPQSPFSDLKLTFNNGAFASLGNPLACGTARTKATFAPYSTGESLPAILSEFAVDGNGQGGACATPAPFAPAQSTSATPATAGAGSTFTLNLQRPDGQQYISSVRAKLPSGLLGNIPTVPLCGEAQASAGECPASSQIGVVAVQAGAGSQPYMFSGSVYLTGPYNGSPYGLSIVVPAQAGPFNLGNVKSRATIGVDPRTAQVIVTDPSIPTIVAGIPIRLKELTVTLNRQGFERNPTSCGVLTAETSLISTTEGTAGISSPFQSEGCSALGFSPSLSATTSGRPTKAGGASLVTTIKEAAGQSNIRSVLVKLPKQLPSRGSTLLKSCPQAAFEANPASCPEGSVVGSGVAYTPTLPGPMHGSAYFVSHAGEAFPDLDLVLEGNNGIRIILVGNTVIKQGITTTDFAANPDVPLSSFQLSLPMGPHSALSAYGSLCVPTLLMPTTITAQNGKVVTRNTTIAPSGCGVQVVGRRVIASTDYLTLKTFAAGRIVASGPGLYTASRSLGSASGGAGLAVSLSHAGRSRRRPFSVRIKVTFIPRKGSRSVAYTTATFR